MITDDDIFLMSEAMRLAQQGEGMVNPNPLVGALIVRGDDVVARGWHRRYGYLHAEREAFLYADEHGEDVSGCTMYVTLEPCCHHGHQPPCTEAIIEHGIRRVVVGLQDPNPLVAGKGVELLRQAGIVVEVMECALQALSTTKNQTTPPPSSLFPHLQKLIADLKTQNRFFLKYISTSLPWVTAKWAMTLDGKIATTTGDSKWITGEEARQYVHLVRRNHSAILCGIGTVMADNPLLNVRLSEDVLQRLGIQDNEVRQPVRIVADRQARIPLESQLVSTAREYPLVIAYADGADEEKLQQLRDAGVVLWNCNTLSELIQRAGAEKIDSILLESGGTLSEALLREGLIDEVLAFIAPKLIGGKHAKTPIEGDGIEQMSEAVELKRRTVHTFGNDILISGLIEKRKVEKESIASLPTAPPKEK